MTRTRWSKVTCASSNQESKTFSQSRSLSSFKSGGNFYCHLSPVSIKSLGASIPKQLKFGRTNHEYMTTEGISGRPSTLQRDMFMKAGPWTTTLKNCQAQNSMQLVTSLLIVIYNQLECDPLCWQSFS